MSERLREYWARVRELERALPDPVHLVSQIVGASGAVSLASRPAAARVLADGQARRATEEEIKAFRERETRSALVAEALQQRRFAGVLIQSSSKGTDPK